MDIISFKHNYNNKLFSNVFLDIRFNQNFKVDQKYQVKLLNDGKGQKMDFGIVKCLSIEKVDVENIDFVDSWLSFEYPPELMKHFLKQLAKEYKVSTDRLVKIVWKYESS